MALLRARQLQIVLDQIERLPEAERQAVRAHVRPEDAAQIRGAAPFDWIPMKLSVDLAHAVTDGLGRDGARKFFREQFAVALQGAVLGSMVAAVSRHVADPRSFLRWMPRMHDLLFRGVGRVVISASPDRPEAIASLVDLPPELAGDRVWLDRYAASVAAAEVFWRNALDCEVAGFSADDRFARFRIWWNEPRSARAR
jgi:hypothetical protein